MKNKIEIEPSSFRDPSGYVFYKNGKVFRKINKVYKENFNFLMKSGLADRLMKDSLLLPFESVDNQIIESQKIPFISYPYEWCFSQLKEAALLTIKTQKIALEYNLSLKDASAYNIQFFKGKPIHIDILSFEKYKEGRPWVAYKQFCQHFLAPLTLVAYKDFRLSQLSHLFIDGVPLDLASVLLPKLTWFNFSITSHIHLHARSQEYFAGKGKKIEDHWMKFSRHAFQAILDNLENTINHLKWNKKKTQWADYYSSTNYSQAAFLKKKKIVERFLNKNSARTAWDLGANTGEFSRIASNNGIFTVAFDIDPVAVEENYKQVRKSGEKNLLPLCLDLTNPSPSLGWANSERKSLMERGPADCVLALALIHHLAISNNIPFEKIAQFLSVIGQKVIIEFVPKKDTQIQKLLLAREDIFSNYNKHSFENSFSLYFNIIESEEIEKSGRIIYLLERK